MKVCRNCLVEKPLDQFSVKRAQKDGLQPYCKPCNRARAREWREEHLPEEVQRDWAAAIHRHGLTVRQYEELLRRQEGACAICKIKFDGTRRHRPNIDHDHKCCPGTHSCGSCVRGLLCVRCNVSLHPADVDRRWLIWANAYLDATNSAFERAPSSRP